MTPYYSDDLVTLYHGDARRILPSIGEVALVITDPPYQSLDVQVGKGTTTRLIGLDQLSGKRLASSERGSWFATLDAAALSAVFAQCRALLPADGAFYIFADVKSGLRLFPALAPANVLVWDKGKIGMGYSWRRMHEWIAYCPQAKHTLRSKALGDIIRCAVPPKKVHSTEKPISVLLPLIENSSDAGDTVLDPFAGSGSTLFAAKSLNRRAIGVEISERNCEVAANRCQQEILGLGGVA